MNQAETRDLVNRLTNKVAKPRTLHEKNEVAKENGEPRYIFHRGRRYEVSEGGLKVGASNPDLALAAEEQLRGEKMSDAEKQERKRKMYESLKSRDDVLLVTESARTQVVSISDTQNLSDETLKPQPGPVMTKPASESNQSPAGDEPKLEPVPQDENILLNEVELDKKDGEDSSESSKSSSKSSSNKSKSKDSKSGK